MPIKTEINFTDETKATGEFLVALVKHWYATRPGTEQRAAIPRTRDEWAAEIDTSMRLPDIGDRLAMARHLHETLAACPDFAITFASDDYVVVEYSSPVRLTMTAEPPRGRSTQTALILQGTVSAEIDTVVCRCAFAFAIPARVAGQLHHNCNIPAVSVASKEKLPIF